MSRTAALQLIDELMTKLADTPNDDNARGIRYSIHGAAHLACRLGFITCDEWDALDSKAAHLGTNT